jgi:hypothetical protein
LITELRRQGRWQLIVAVSQRAKDPVTVEILTGLGLNSLTPHKLMVPARDCFGEEDEKCEAAIEDCILGLL